MGTGNTPVRFNQRAINAVHPRGYGEHLPVSLAGAVHSGSSPWVRGTLARMTPEERQQRFIPVGTGNTDPSSHGEVKLSVHPRGYGEHLHAERAKNDASGSSPWVRGTLKTQLNTRPRLRFIPVGTGNTFARSDIESPAPVHPRGYGEHKKYF